MVDDNLGVLESSEGGPFDLADPFTADAETSAEAACSGGAMTGLKGPPKG